jgi:hypothetical protein
MSVCNLRPEPYTVKATCIECREGMRITAWLLTPTISLRASPVVGNDRWGVKQTG